MAWWISFSGIWMLHFVREPHGCYKKIWWQYYCREENQYETWTCPHCPILVGNHDFKCANVHRKSGHPEKKDADGSTHLQNVYEPPDPVITIPWWSTPLRKGWDKSRKNAKPVCPSKSLSFNAVHIPFHTEVHKSASFAPRCIYSSISTKVGKYLYVPPIWVSDNEWHLDVPQSSHTSPQNQISRMRGQNSRLRPVSIEWRPLRRPLTPKHDVSFS